MMKTLFVCMVFVLAFVYADIDLQDIELPDIGDLSAIKNRCDRLGGEGTYEAIKTSRVELQNCLKGLVDFTTLKNEIEESKKTGSMDEVFGKYCNKRPIVKNCLRNFTDSARKCLEESEKSSLNLTLDILRQLGEFVCFRDGDRIAMFVAEGGVECVKEHTEGIKNCINATFNIPSDLSPTSFDTSSLPSLVIDKKKCDDLGKLQICIVEELEKCKDTTPANIVDALFRFIKRNACNTPKTKRSLHNLMKRSFMGMNWAYDEPNHHNKILQILTEDRCNKNGGPDAYNQLQTATTSFWNCANLKEKTHLLASPADEMKRDLRNCAIDFNEKMKNCLGDDEKYFADYYLDQMSSLIDLAFYLRSYMTKPSGDAREIYECLQGIRTYDVKEKLKSCIRDVARGLSGDLSRPTVCTVVKDSEQCISKIIQKTCTRDVGIERIKRLLFSTPLQVCIENV